MNLETNKEGTAGGMHGTRMVARLRHKDLTLVKIQVIVPSHLMTK